jgi:hypothetical protein
MDPAKIMFHDKTDLSGSAWPLNGRACGPAWGTHAINALPSCDPAICRLSWLCTTVCRPRLGMAALGGDPGLPATCYVPHRECCSSCGGPLCPCPPIVLSQRSKSEVRSVLLSPPLLTAWPLSIAQPSAGSGQALPSCTLQSMPFARCTGFKWWVHTNCVAVINISTCSKPTPASRRACGNSQRKAVQNF